MKGYLLVLLIVFPALLSAQTLDSVLVTQQVDSLIKISRTLTDQRKFEDALRFQEQAEQLILSNLNKEHASYGKCLFNKGRLFNAMEKFQQAEISYLEAKKILEHTIGKETFDYASCLLNLGILYRSLGRYKDAEPLLVETQVIREKIFGKEHQHNANAKSALGTLYSLMGRYEKAEPLLIEAKNIREKLFGKEHPDYMAITSNLAAFYYFIGRYDETERIYLENKTILERLHQKETENYVGLICNLGNLYWQTGRYEAANLILFEAKDLNEKISGKEDILYATILNTIGLVYWDTEQLDLAEKVLVEAKNIREKLFGKENITYAESLNNLGIFYIDAGRYDSAESTLLEALRIKEMSIGKEHPDYAQTLSNLAVVYLSTKQFDLAEKAYKECISIQEKASSTENRLYLISINGLANLYADMERYEEAEKLHLQNIKTREKILGKDHPDYAQSLNNLGTLYLETKHYTEALEIFSKSLEIIGKIKGKEHSYYAATLSYIADTYIYNGKIDESVNYLLESNKIFTSIQRKSTLYLSSKELASYTSIFKENLNLFFSHTQLIEDKEAMLKKQSFNNALFYKGFLLNSSSKINNLASLDTTSARLTDQLKSYHRLLAKEYAKMVIEKEKVQELETKANEIEKELVRTVAGFGEALRQVNWQEVQQQLKPGEAAVEFVQYKFHNPDPTDSVMYAALVLRPGDQHPHFLALFEEKQLEKILYLEQGKQKKELLTQIYSRGIKPVKKGNLKGLYDLVWQPLDSLLVDVKTVYFSPSVLLHRINFNAIPIDKKTSLSDRLQLVQLGSTRSLVVPDLNRTTFTNDALLFGGIQYELDTTQVQKDTLTIESVTASRGELSFRYSDRSVPLRGESWRYLPGTEKEVQNIQALLKQSQFSTQVLSGKNATEEAVKNIGKNQASPRVLHLATHGFFFPDPKDTSKQKQLAFDQEPAFKISDHPMIRSGLILAGGNYAWKTGTPFKPDQEDGILTAYEISQMNLSNTELVVLSACETGLGDIQGNEGVYGLQRAFKIAGVKNIIMSLWQVPDQQTQELMTRFYQQWLQEGKPIRPAFEEAQRAMRARYKDPYLWAGFVQVQ